MDPITSPTVAELAALIRWHGVRRDWQSMGEHRWRGNWDWPDAWCYVLFSDDSTQAAQSMVAKDQVDLARFDIEQHTWEWLTQRIAYDQLPLCVVPGCESKGEVLFTAAGKGRLASKDWQRGDPIRICPDHAYDVYRAVGCEQQAHHLPEWLRVDARPSSWLHEFDVACDAFMDTNRTFVKILSLKQDDQAW